MEPVKINCLIEAMTNMLSGVWHLVVRCLLAVGVRHQKSGSRHLRLSEYLQLRQWGEICSRKRRLLPEINGIRILNDGSCLIEKLSP